MIISFYSNKSNLEIRQNSDEHEIIQSRVIPPKPGLIDVQGFGTYYGSEEKNHLHTILCLGCARLTSKGEGP